MQLQGVNLIKNPINSITIEGPDLSGKTTLYNQIHKLTNYRWNIQDRSNLSMLVHAKHYGRNEFFYVENLKKELYHLNNHMIILLPSWEVIVKRFEKRGDEIQNLISLRNIYKLFEEAVDDIGHFPNVIIIKKEIDDYIVGAIIQSLHSFERKPFYNISKNIMQTCIKSDTSERVGINFTSYDDGSYSDVDISYLNYEKEKLYYKNIKKQLKNKIMTEFELSNSNFLTNRRFIYSSETCISLAHFLYREDILECQFFIRSSDTKNILKYDLNFLKHLTGYASSILELPENTIAKLNVFINSAHIPDIIDEGEKNES